MVAVGESLLERPREIVVGPRAEVGRQRAGAGTVLRPSPASRPVIWSVRSRRARWSLPMRSASCASAIAAFRPSSGASPACAARPVAWIRNQRAPLRRDDLAVRAPALQAEDGVHTQQPAARRRAAVSRLLIGDGHDLEQPERPRALGQRRAAWSATATPPFMSATPGPSQRSPSLGRGARRRYRGEDGVVVAEQRDLRLPRAAERGVEGSPPGVSTSSGSRP